MTDEPARVTGPLLDVLEAFLASAGGELHGWAIIKATRRGGPTVYKILERLTEWGWITTRWDDRAAEPDKPRRRYYRLTGTGAERARSLVCERRAAGLLRPSLGWGVS